MNLEKKYFILLLFLILGANTVKAHPFYVSICQVDYNSETRSLEIALKVFSNDLLLGLENKGKTKIYLGEKKENPKADEYIFDYVKSQMIFTVNHQKVNYNFVGKEMQDDVVWVYLEVENVNALTSLGVESKLLTEIFDDQKNIVQVNNKGSIKNMLLNKNNSVDEIEF